MGGYALPECVNGKRRYAQQGDPGDGYAVRGDILVQADLAHCPGQRTESASEKDGTNEIEPAWFMPINGRVSDQQDDRDQRQGRIDRKYPLPAKAFGQPTP